MKQGSTQYIDAPSTCNLVINQNYTVVCPSAEMIQPKRALFKIDDGPNYQPSFQLTLAPESSTLSIILKEEGSLDETGVWSHRINLKKPPSRRETESASTAPQHDPLRLLYSCRSLFVSTVSDPILDQLLDQLLNHMVLTFEEMERARTMSRAEKARALIDTVTKKGSRAASILIREYCQLDPMSDLSNRFRTHFDP